jgi:predicted phosphodiesterase
LLGGLVSIDLFCSILFVRNDIMSSSERSIAIIADVHGNRWALEAVLRDIDRRGIEQIFNLGDNLLGPLDPVGTANLLIERNIPGISGNGDRELIVAPEQPSASLLFTSGRVESAHLNWLRTLPAMAVVADDLFLCHGTPASDETYLLETVTDSGSVLLRETSGIVGDVAGVGQPLIFCGHSHQPRTVFLPSGQLVINPGSVGLPAYTEELPAAQGSILHGMEAGTPHARYAVVTKEGMGWRVEMVLVPYDWALAAGVARDHGRADWAEWIATGRAVL